jgi:hypothetical protein
VYRDRPHYAAAQIRHWQLAIARSQLEGVELGLTLLDRVLAILARRPDLDTDSEFSRARLDRLRAGMLERGFEWEKRRAHAEGGRRRRSVAA